MYKVFVNDHQLVFFNAGQTIDLPPGALVIPVTSPGEIAALTTAERLTALSANMYFACWQPDEVFAAFSSRFRLIDAAGGLVSNSRGEYLFIFRRGFWDLPKGKMEPGETPEGCALREVEEECGIHGLRLGEFICHTYHTYTHKNAEVLKRTWWYQMNYPGNGPLKVQTEEDIEEARWVAPHEMAGYLDKCYASIRELATIKKTHHDSKRAL